MLLTCAGLHGTGKTTVAKRIANEFGLTHYSTGEMFRQMAKEHDMSLAEFNKCTEAHPEIDKELDKRMERVGKEEKDVILDGQLCWYFLDKTADHKILLKCDQEERISRILSREREKKEKDITRDEIRKNTLERERSERERYKEIYGIDISDEEFVEEHHDIIIDTTDKNIDQVVDAIINEIE